MCLLNVVKPYPEMYFLLEQKKQRELQSEGPLLSQYFQSAVQSEPKSAKAKDLSVKAVCW